MKYVSIEISDDPIFCFDSTKKLCRFVGTSDYGTKWWCLLGEQVELFSDVEGKKGKLMKCQRCLDEFWFSQG